MAKHVVLAYTDAEAEAMEEMLIHADWSSLPPDKSAAFKRARQKLREGRKQFKIENEMRNH